MSANAHIAPPTNCLIIGLGQTGLSCAKFLVQQGIDVAVMDTREIPPSLGLLQEDFPEVVIKTGGLDSQWIQQADMIVLSPGIDPRLPELESARNIGVEMVGDIELFARYVNAPIIAITGSNGKSTVTTLLAEMAETAGKIVKVGGNLGTPALDLISDPAPDFYIVELSSFQLETVKSLNAFASTILNISPDHLDRYNNVDDYQQTKARIYSGDGVMVLNQDDSIVNNLAQIQRNKIGFSLHESEGVNFGLIYKNGKPWLAEGNQPLIAASSLKIVGKHNIANALAALALGSAMALPMTAMLTALQTYVGLPHRCCFVAEIDGVRWFNDSKATNVGACAAAIGGMADSGTIVLIAGGQAKEQDFTELTPLLASYVKTVILIGQDAALFSKAIPTEVQQLQADSMIDAVNKAHKVSRSGDNILLSPACASFDMFDGYIERGEMFEQAVMVLKS